MQLFLFFTVLLAVLVGVTQQMNDASTTTVFERVNRVMRSVQDHCDATTGLNRRKRESSDLSEENLRKVILNIIKNCLEEKPRPTAIPVHDACHSPHTINLNQSWRKDNRGHNIQPGPDDSYNCDADMFDNIHWFRISGDAGNFIRNTCSPSYSCGSHGGIWTNATLPTRIGQSVQVPLYGSWSNNCTWYPFDVPNPLTVIRCSYAYGDYVYKIDGKTGCQWSVCTMS